MGEITGKVVQVLPEGGYTKKDGTFVKQQVVIIEYASGNYANKLAIELGEKLVNKLSVGQEATFSYNATSTEYNGKFYTKVSAWKFDVVGSAPQTQQSQNNPPVANFEEDSNLPF